MTAAAFDPSHRPVTGPAGFPNGRGTAHRVVPDGAVAVAAIGVAR